MSTSGVDPPARRWRRRDRSATARQFLRPARACCASSGIVLRWKNRSWNNPCPYAGAAARLQPRSPANRNSGRSHCRIGVRVASC